MHTPEHTPLDSVETLVRKGNTAFMVELSDILHTPLFHIQKTPVTLISFIGAVIFFLGAYLFSQFLQRALRLRIFPRFKLEEGLQYTFLRLTHYFFIFIGLVLGLQFIGLDLSSLAVIAGLLSVGIGFGLQNIASNFIAGIILLFERPIKVGDRDLRRRDDRRRARDQDPVDDDPDPRQYYYHRPQLRLHQRKGDQLVV